MENSKENSQQKNATSMAAFFNITNKKEKTSEIAIDTTTPMFSQKAFYFENNQIYNGQLVLLDYIIYFFPRDTDLKKLRFNKQFFVIPIFSIKKIDHSDNFQEFTIKTKDFRTLKFKTCTFHFYDTIKAHFDMTFYDIFKTSSTAFRAAECSRIMCRQS